MRSAKKLDTNLTYAGSLWSPPRGCSSAKAHKGAWSSLTGEATTMVKTIETQPEWNWANNGANLGVLQAALEKAEQSQTPAGRNILIEGVRSTKKLGEKEVQQYMDELQEFVQTKTHLQILSKIHQRLLNMRTATQTEDN